MSDPVLILKLVQTLYAPFQKGVTKVWQRVRIRLFKSRHIKPPLSDSEALSAATSMLGGDVPLARSFRNISTNHIFIAALGRSSEQNVDWRVSLLEQLGSTFHIIWKSEVLASLSKPRLEVEDIDDDGNCEVIYEDQSFGTGGGYRSLNVYSIESRQVTTLKESLNWQDLSGPLSPVVTIEPHGEKDLLRQIETLASKMGFLKPPTEVDFEKPEFAVQRWHKENGKFPQARIRTHYYKGAPHSLATLVVTVRASDRIWFSFFKGPMFEYDLANDRHCVVYSPAWFYNWVKCAAFDGERLWCGVHLMKGLLSYEPNTGTLLKHETLNGVELPEVEEIRCEVTALVLNKAVRLPIGGLLRRVHPTGNA